MGKLLLILVVLIVSFQISPPSASAKGSSADSANKKLIMLANVNLGRNTSDITMFKAEAALNFAALASGKFGLVNSDSIKSLVGDMLSKGDSNTTPLIIANKFNADYIYFMGINVIENMIRVDISSINAKDTSKKSGGVGYASLRYKRMKDEKMLYDPELLTATMRAFAVVQKDSSIFKTSDSNWVKPVPTLMIGGINYINSNELPAWDIFAHKEISSYDAVETIFDEIKQSNDYAIYDIQTRDSVYALFNLVGIENYMSPTSSEIKSLSEMEVGYYITGNLERSEFGALLDLYLCQITKSHLEIIKKKTLVVKEDSEKDYRETIRKAARGILSP